MERIGYIYKITSPSGKIYIGKTNNLRNRICAYRNAQKSNTNTLIYTSIKKYGWDAHVFKVIDSASINVLNELEISYIQKYNSYRHTNPYGLNLTIGGEGTYGRIDSVETRKKRAAHHIGSTRSKETRQLMSLAKKGSPSNRKNCIISQETKNKISKSNTGKIKPVEFHTKKYQTLLDKLIKTHGAILQIDRSTNSIIKEWIEIPKYISNQMNIEYASIKRALNKKYKTAGGYVWKYKTELQ
jgi:group I intron endonuclease